MPAHRQALIFGVLYACAAGLMWGLVFVGPAVLAEYARKFSAEPGRWYMLTGTMDALHNLSRNAFMLGDVTGDLEHSTRFVLLDRKSRIRGFYHLSLIHISEPTRPS